MKILEHEKDQLHADPKKRKLSKWRNYCKIKTFSGFTSATAPI